jgi:uncharacterized membrane protein YraQ (UPF0718 family)
VTRAGEGTLDVRAPEVAARTGPGDRGLPTLVALGALAGAFALAVAGRAAGAADVPEVETFVLIFASIVIEALPFVLLGALVSAAIGVYVPDRVFDRIGRLPLALQVPGAALGGLAFPVCECGSVPVARRLILRGVHPAAGIAFMLAAPVMNPIVLLSTWVAYSGRGTAVEMVGGRIVLGLGLAALAGVLIGRFSPAEVLRPRGPEAAHQHGHGHDHGHGASRGERYVEHLAGDFLFMGKFIVLGAALAAAMQTLIPQSVVSPIASSVILAPLALMGLAFMLSLCSEADAFVAVSLTDFTPGAQLAFLVFGPMLDTKLTLLYGATFRRAFALRLLLVAAPFLLLATIVFDKVVA